MGDASRADVLEHAVPDQEDDGHEAVAIVAGGCEKIGDPHGASDFHCALSNLRNGIGISHAPCFEDQARIRGPVARDMISGPDDETISKFFGSLLADPVDGFRNLARCHLSGRLYGNGRTCAVFEVRNEVECMFLNDAVRINVGHRIRLLVDILHIRMSQKNLSEITFQGALVEDLPVCVGIDERTSDGCFRF